MGLRAVFLAICLALGLALSAAAQTAENRLDFTAWEELAARTEAAIESGRTSNAVLDELRLEIADWRSDFLAAESANQARVETLRSQIDALGAPPSEGETEAPEIATRRAELNERLAALDAPRRAANEAYNRADGLIGELDAVIRARQTDRLLELGPTPLNPAIWPDAVTFSSEIAGSVRREFERSWSSPAQRATTVERLPVTIILTLIGLTLLTRGRSLMQRFTVAVQSRSGAMGHVALGFLVSLGQIALPVLGLYALSQAALSTGLPGLRGTELIQVLPVFGFLLFGPLWLAYRLFPPGDAAIGPLDLNDKTRADGRWYLSFLGILLAVSILLGTIFDFEPDADTAIAVISFPVLVLMGLALFRLGRFLTRSVAPSYDALETAGFRTQLSRLLGRAAMFVGVIGPVAAAIGYTNLSAAMVYPTAMTMALISALVILHGPIRDLYAVFTGRSPGDAGEALIPVLISFGITLATTPLFALIWGVRPAELQELWARFLAGVTFGETRISPVDFLTVIIVFLLGYGLTRLIQGTLKSTVLPRTKLDVGGRNAITAGVGYVGIFVAGLVAITAAGINLSSLAIFASALAVGVGFGLQNIVSNFVSGIILLIERPISEGDWIEVGGQMGYVRDISVRSTRIETFDRTDVIIPNADLVSGTVVNYTRGNLTGRAIVPVGVAYGTDTKKVEGILREVAEAHPLVSLNPPPAVLFRGFGADSLDFEIRAILRDVNFMLAVKSDMNHEIAKRFAEEGIEIPFAQRDIWLRNPEALRGDDPKEEPTT